MRKIYYLNTCTTCKAIIKETGIGALSQNRDRFVMQDIKSERITSIQLDEMKKMAGTYEALFSQRALKYKELGLKDKQLTEKDYRRFILNEYTFLKRPVAIINNRIFIGNDKKTIAELKKAVHELR